MTGQEHHRDVIRIGDGVRDPVEFIKNRIFCRFLVPKASVRQMRDDFS
jgi:hypothetical protein